MSGRVNIDTLRKTPDTARAYKWDVEISSNGLSDTISKTINLRCTTADQPQYTHEPIVTSIRSFDKVEIGAGSWNPLNFSTVEVITFEILESLLALSIKQFNHRTGEQTKKEQHELSIKLFLLGLDDQPVKTWNIIGGVLLNVSPDGLTGDKSTPLNVSFSVQYDYAELK